MQIVLKVLIGAMVIIAALVGFSPREEKMSISSDRPPTSKRVSVAPHTYYYYPKANFYYDSTNGNYIGWDSTEASWKETDKLPVQVDMGKTVRIGPSSEPVWKENEQHRLIYSVSLYGAPEDFKKPEKIQPRQKPKSDSTVKPEKKKTGVGKFFNRIFSPKK